ncbi:MAG TPA: prepilin-type N-terminal cleavage/methylation domain-containing protein, partial [Alphaproteobacteria bacterium]
MISLRISRKTSRGFTLLELMLALAIFAAVMMGILSLLTTYSERELARSTNKYMMAVLDATRATLSDPTNFNVLYEAAAATYSAGTGGAYQLIADKDAPAADNILKTFVVNTVPTGAVTIQASRVLPAQFTENSPIRSPVRILLRIADRLPPDETDVRALEIFVVTTTPRPDSIVQKAANEGGFHGGVLRTYNAKANGLLNSAFNGWRLPMNEPVSRLSRTAWYGGLQAALNSTTDGSYLIYYDYVNSADVTSDYLYRIRDPSGTNRLNTMYGPINLGGNNIIGADDVLVGNATAVPFTADPFNPAGTVA